MASSSKTVILSAPAAWGKTRNAEALRKEFGCGSVVDDWHTRLAVKPGALHLTNVHSDRIGQRTGCKIVSRGW